MRRRPGRNGGRCELPGYVIDVPLSVLDLSPVAAGTTPGQALGQTTELARRTEELGYGRFWVAEHHNMPAIASSAPALYRQHFRPSRWLQQPYAMVAVSAICADTDERAQWLSGPAAVSFLKLRAGTPQPLASPQEAAGYPYSRLERELAAERFAQQAVGSPELSACD
jgi:alkanesulfonate monooxygenase SsuD/methylene tetrahydromethanopterin reductase-like flavin-dependent oxidoreductase (luciferase family)